MRKLINILKLGLIDGILIVAIGSIFPILCIFVLISSIFTNYSIDIFNIYICVFYLLFYIAMIFIGILHQAKGNVYLYFQKNNKNFYEIEDIVNNIKLKDLSNEQINKVYIFYKNKINDEKNVKKRIKEFEHRDMSEKKNNLLKTI